ncbi:type II and III secretion system protein family protein [Rhodovulum sp.]|uniref:type II and III secretion system protein family protein n=1 Tax=Rhodovulum sp. TaxID=34009 RepID=UPI0018242A71|nr:type II and III secretion system protein family protein [Rhodovulum sp.]HDR29941.1 type II and III secretion system protein family protein [Rhodovulum sp.]
MKTKSVLVAGLVGLAAATGAVTETQAQSLRTLSGQATGQLTVPMNRAVVVESDEVFAELSISNPQIADISTLSDRTIYVLGKSPGRTTLTLLGPNGRLITNVEVRVTPDMSELKERLREVLPGEPIEVRSANDGLVLSGTVSSAQALDRALDLASRYAPERISNLMMVAGSQQVMLKVRFAEMSRNVSKALSSRLGISGTFDGGDGTIIGSLGAGRTSSTGNLTISGDLGAFQLNLALQALEGKGFVRTLAEPNLTALSGQEARFLAGGEFPIPVPQEGGTISIDYKPFGIGLNFTPRVVGENINLRLDAEVSGLDDTASYNVDDVTYPGFRTRRTSTTVELHDGESFAIAGLLQDDFFANNAQVPWISDVPVLGALFRSSEYERRNSELVIIITAHLVSPTRGEALALPTDRVQPPSERDLFLSGKLSSPKTPKSGAAGEVARQDFSGSYGYVME